MSRWFFQYMICLCVVWCAVSLQAQQTSTPPSASLVTQIASSVASPQSVAKQDPSRLISIAAKIGAGPVIVLMTPEAYAERPIFMTQTNAPTPTVSSSMKLLAQDSPMLTGSLTTSVVLTRSEVMTLQVTFDYLSADAVSRATFYPLYRQALPACRMELFGAHKDAQHAVIVGDGWFIVPAGDDPLISKSTPRTCTAASCPEEKPDVPLSLYSIEYEQPLAPLSHTTFTLYYCTGIPIDVAVDALFEKESSDFVEEPRQ